MPPFKTEAVILRSTDFQERDRLVVFFSDGLGKMRGVAKGAKRSRRRFGANLDLLAHVRIQGFERPHQDLVRIEGADLLEYFEGIRRDLTGFALGCYLAEWVDGCTAERQPIPKLLPLVLWVLSSLDAGEEGEGLLRIFEAKVLDLVGYRPELRRCVACGAELQRSSRVVVQVGRGGALCHRCAGGVKDGLVVSMGTLRILEDARKLDLDRLHRIAFSSEALVESRALLRAFYAYHVGRQLRSASFLESLEGHGGRLQPGPLA
ncbi:MAG: DNA repair protein RecO [Candidatus Bipolaricaulia bacterium]